MSGFYICQWLVNLKGLNLNFEEFMGPVSFVQIDYLLNVLENLWDIMLHIQRSSY